MIFKNIRRLFVGDKTIWMAFLFICIISIVEVYSASSGLTYKSGNYWGPIIKHTFILLLGTMAMIFTALIPCRYFKLFRYILIPISYVTLILVLIIGETTNDAQRWMSFGFIQFQPSEIAKGTIILFTAHFLSLYQTENGTDNKGVWRVLLYSVPMLVLIGKENFSTVALILVVMLMMFVVARVKLKTITYIIMTLVLAASCFLLLVIAIGNVPNQDPNSVYTTKTEHVKVGRFDTWKSRLYKHFNSKKSDNPNDIDLDKDAQVAHANIAVASSNVIGKGPGNSVERDFLPQAYSDFIYTIIIEELGIVGAIFVVFLYITILVRTGRIARKCENSFPAFLATGYALLLTTQALANMCVAVGLAPVTGQPLPFISRGGTSSLINCIFLGVILSVSRTAKKRETTQNVATNNLPKAQQNIQQNAQQST